MANSIIWSGAAAVVWVVVSGIEVFAGAPLREIVLSLGVAAAFAVSLLLDRMSP